MPPSSPTAALPAQSRGFRRFWRAIKQLFHEVIGAMFAVLAFGWLSLAFRAWTRDMAHWLIGVTILVTAVFVFLSVGSFRRARQL